MEIAAELRSQNDINGAQAKQQQQADGIQAFRDIIQFAGKIEGDIRVIGLHCAPFIPDQAVGLQGIDFLRVDIALQGNRPAEIVVENALRASPRRAGDQFFQRNGPAVRQRDGLPHQVAYITVLAFFRHHPDFYFLPRVLENGHDFTIHVSMHGPPHAGRVEAGPLHGFTVKAQYQFGVSRAVIQGDVPVHLLPFKKVTQFIGSPQHRRVFTAQHLDTDGLARGRPPRYFHEGDVNRTRHAFHALQDIFGNNGDRAAIMGARV